MFEFAVLVGIYSYFLFLLGLLGSLGIFPLTASLIVFLTVSLTIFIRNHPLLKLINFVNKLATVEKAALFLLVVLMLINLIGALGPETAFDSLWYHLTIPKVYLANQKIFYITGGLLYYSVMPKLIDIIYIPFIALKIDILTKLLSFLFSILTVFVIYRTARLFFTKHIALITVLVFYSNLVVSWEATTSYIDFGRTFFESLAVYYLIIFLNKKKNEQLIKIGIAEGLSISSKILAVGSLIPLFLTLLWDRIKLKKIFLCMLISVLIPLPWFIFAYVSTGNLFYPFFSPLFQTYPGVDLLAPVKLLRSPDPISPIYFISLPLIVLYYKKYKPIYKKTVIYAFLTFLVWWISPQTGGGRFLMPYLPVYSILVGGVIFYSSKNVAKYLTLVVVFITVVTIFYRLGANMRYLPVVLGKESRQEYLSKNLKYDFGDFYDTDGYFSKHITQKDVVLTYNIHNLYYIDFPFIDSTWIKKGDKFNYLLVRGNIPTRFKKWKLVYKNNKTNIKLYSGGGKMWEY
ncbi:MAG TPA: glycosyltransferase family 39 protein [Patescibacteria group bacterium]|nr:glycosyltransferase family 39 protein [Patescibacteria group bacterium]